MSEAQEIGSATKPVRKGRARVAAKPNMIPPSPDPIETEATHGAIPIRIPPQSLGDSHISTVAHPRSADAQIVAEIADMQKIRRFCIKSQSRCDRSMEALIATRLGYRGKDTPEKERAAIFKLCSQIRGHVEKTVATAIKAAAKESALEQKRDRTTNAAKFNIEPSGSVNISAIIQKAWMSAIDDLGPDVEAARSVAHLIPLSASSREVWDKQRKETEAKMELYARQLPVAAWAQSIRGFGLLNLAIVCGEAGEPLCDYRSIAGLWKRCGLAVINGERQRQKIGEAGKEQKYNPKRRAEIYVVGSVSVFLAQKPGMRYRDIYDARRCRTQPYIEATEDLDYKHPGKWTSTRCHNDARRIMTKALLEDLYKEWKRIARNDVAIAAE